MEGGVCDNLATTIGGISAIILFVFSEVLPFIHSVKYNGLFEAIYEETRKRTIKNEEIPEFP